VRVAAPPEKINRREQPVERKEHRERAAARASVLADTNDDVAALAPDPDVEPVDPGNRKKGQTNDS
jgi:hypothetical protein